MIIFAFEALECFMMFASASFVIAIKQYLRAIGSGLVISYSKSILQNVNSLIICSIWLYKSTDSSCILCMLLRISSMPRDKEFLRLESSSWMGPSFAIVSKAPTCRIALERR